jgi:hypothetical protein
MACYMRFWLLNAVTRYEISVYEESGPMIDTTQEHAWLVLRYQR